MILAFILSGKAIVALCVLAAICLFCAYIGIGSLLERITIYGSVGIIKQSSEQHEDGSYGHISFFGNPNKEYPVYNSYIKGIKEGDYVGIRKRKFESIYTVCLHQSA